MGLIDTMIKMNTEENTKGYDTQIKDTEKARAKAAYDYHYNKDLYNANKDYFDSIGVSDPSASYVNDEGKTVNAFTDAMNQYDKELKNLSDEKAKVEKQNKYNVFGDGIIGGILNPWVRAGSAVGDFVTTGTDAWTKGDRDLLSDLGAAGQAALDVATLGTGTAAKAAGTTALKTAGKMAGLGAGYGALEGLRNEGGNALTSEGMGNIASSALTSAAVGGGLGAAGYGVGKLWNKYSTPTSNSTALIPYSGANSANNQQLQGYMKTLGLDGSDLSAGTLNSARRTAMKNTAKNVGYETAEGQAQRTAINNAYQNLLNASKTATATPTYTAPSYSLGTRLKTFGSNIPTMGRDLRNTRAGQTVSNLMKTKTGKIGAGVGAGLVLNNILNGNQNNTNTATPSADVNNMTAEELYNYVYNGGY